MAHDVFISYSSHDKAIADATCAKLENRGIRCWIAPRDVLAGTEYGASIVDAIGACQVFVVIFSAHANASPQVKREVERAVSKGKIIVPLRIEDILPTGAMELALSNTHWLDALTPPVETHIESLRDAVATLLARGPGIEQAKSQHRGTGTLDAQEARQNRPPVDHVQPSVETSAARSGSPYCGQAGSVGKDGALVFNENERLIRLPSGNVSSIAFSADSRSLAVGSSSGLVTVWDTDSLTKKREFFGSGGYVTSVCFFREDSATLVVDGTLQVWDIATSESTPVIRDAEDEDLVVTRASVTHQGDRIALVRHTVKRSPFPRVRTLEIRDAKTWEVIGAWEFEKCESGTTTPFFDRDGRNILLGLMGHSDSSVLLLDYVNQQHHVLGTLHYANRTGDLVAFSPDGEWVAFSCADGKTAIVRAEQGQKTRKYSSGTDITPGVFSQSLEGLRVIVGTNVVNPVDGAFCFSLEDASRAPLLNRYNMPASFSPDGQHIAAADGPMGYVVIFSAENGHFEQKLLLKSPHKGPVRKPLLSFSPNSQFLALSNSDGSVSLWNRAFVTK